MLLVSILVLLSSIAKADAADDSVLNLEYQEYSEWSQRVVLYFPSSIKEKDYQNSSLFSYTLKDKNGKGFNSFEVLGIKRGVSEQVL